MSLFDAEADSRDEVDRTPVISEKAMQSMDMRVTDRRVWQSLFFVCECQQRKRDLIGDIPIGAGKSRL
jgi:hypothetical protein